MQEQGLVVVNDGFLNKMSKLFKKFAFRKSTDDIYFENIKKDVKYIKDDDEFLQYEIVLAQRAYRKFVINNKKNIAKDILKVIFREIEENKEKIKRIIEINQDEISYNDICLLIKEEIKNIGKYKYKSKKTGCYQVPIGVIGVECNSMQECVSNMLKAISTRNSIIILNNNYSEYSTESLILLIIKECFKSFGIDDNIVQMYEKEDIDISKLNRYISNTGKIDHEIKKCIYLYQEDDDYKDDVRNELDRLKSLEEYSEYDIKIIKGEFGNIINFLNTNLPYAICMYTNNKQKAYKFMNWINTPNLFINTGICECKGIETFKSKFFRLKNIEHNNIFN